MTTGNWFYQKSFFSWFYSIFNCGQISGNEFSKMSESVGNFEKLFDKLNQSHNEAIKELFRIQAVTVMAPRLDNYFYRSWAINYGIRNDFDLIYRYKSLFTVSREELNRMKLKLNEASLEPWF